MENYKNEIERTRVGSLGSSDAAIVAKVGSAGVEALTDTDLYRLAVMTGQAERVDFQTPAMRLGDKIEMEIYDAIKSKHPQAVSNPLRTDVQMSNYYGFGIISHIDVEVATDEDISVKWYEIKASRKTTDEVLQTYAAQLQWHWMVLNKVAAADVQKSLYLVHYQTGVTEEFDANNITIVPVSMDDIMQGQLYDGLIRLKEFLPTFKYVRPEEMSIRLVGDAEVQSLRERAEEAIIVVKQLETQIEEFKAALKNYMTANGIKKIYSDNYCVTLTAATKVQTFDSKRFKSEQPEMYAQYLKETERAAAVMIKVK